jgi:hypothetical protein
MKSLKSSQVKFDFINGSLAAPSTYLEPLAFPFTIDGDARTITSLA